MKKLALILALCAMVCLTACGGSSPAGSAASATAGAASAATESATSAETTPAPSMTSAEEAAAASAMAENGSDTRTLEATEIQVFVAASLSSSFEELVKLYNETQPNVTVTINADSSGTLQTQIEEGYACDLFFSAATKQMNALQDGGYVIPGTVENLLHNYVVLVTYPGSGTKVTGFENIADAANMALADGSVPVGAYTRTILTNAGVLPQTEDPTALTSQEISQDLGGLEINECSNVSKVAQAVSEGSNEIGTVYYSDCYDYPDSLEIIANAYDTFSDPIIYPMSRIKNQEADELETEAADSFYRFLMTDEAQTVFTDHWFIPYDEA